MPSLTKQTAWDILDGMAHENPPPDPEERWIAYEDFDPPFRVWELEAMRRQGMIEFDRPGKDREEWRFRFTKEGRRTHAALKEGT